MIYAYDRKGIREFQGQRIEYAYFVGRDFRGASFQGSDLWGANFSRANLVSVQFQSATLTGTSFQHALLARSNLMQADLADAELRGADLTGAALQGAKCERASFVEATLTFASLSSVSLMGTSMDGVVLGGTELSDLDASAFCDAKGIVHRAPSAIDARSVMKSYHHPRFKQFMIECGVPPIFAEYMIDCARALGGPLLRSLMQSTFISYGGPDEPFARRIYEGLRAHGVTVFFFPESATIGERIDTEVYGHLQRYDRVILVCSRESLNRPGVLHEIRETFDREARDGGATYLLPVMLDDYVLTEWRKDHPELAARVSRRVVGDFRKVSGDRGAFEAAMSRLLDSLKRERPVD